MATPPNIKRIRSEDFPAEYRQIIDRIAYALNDFQDQTIFNLTKGLDFRNLNQDLKDIDVIIDGSGNIVNPPTIRTNLRTKARLVFVGNAVNLQNPTITPTSQPFISFTVDTTADAQLVRVLGVTGLQNNSQYRLSLLIIGENL